MGLLDMMTGRTTTFTGKIKHITHVMTRAGEVAFFGVLFCDSDEWVRVATSSFNLAESIAFLQLDDSVQIEVKGSIVEVNSTYHKLVRVVVA